MLSNTKRILILAITAIAVNHVCLSQEGKYSIDFKMRPGFIIPHHGYMAYFLSENVNAIQLNLGLTTNGSKFWHKEYDYPIIGVGIHHSNLGNDTLYGNLTGLYFFINRFFLNNSGRFNISNTLSVGLSYASKWHSPANRTNMVLSTPLNVFFQYELGVNYRLFTNHNISASIGLAHASNGSIKEPNLGFNIFTTSLGYRYSFGKPNPVKNEFPDDNTPCSSLNLGIFSSVKSVNAFTGKQYGIVGISAEQLYKFAPLSMLGLELSAYRDSSIPYLLENKSENPITPDQNDSFAMAINATYLMGFERISIAFQPGIYLLNRFYGFGAVTNKVGVRSTVFKGLNLVVAIKAHWLAQADFVEFGIKYSLSKNEK